MPGSALSQHSEETIRIVIAEDHAMFSEWLEQMLVKMMPSVVCLKATNGKDAFDLIQAEQPDLAIVDLNLPGPNGLELIKNLNGAGCRAPVLVLSMHDEMLYAARALRAGARGYISKIEASSTLIKAIRHVMDGEIYLGDKVKHQMLTQLSGRPNPARGSVNALADRELEVLQLMGKGFNGREIATQLGLGETTVDSYRARIKAKLNLRNAADVYSYAAQWVREQGL